MATRKCQKCEGCGCPDCLGTGRDVRAIVRKYGQFYLIPDFKPSDVAELTVDRQREVKGYVQAVLEKELTPEEQ